MGPSPAIELRLLGRFVVVRGGAEVPAADFGGRKARTLLRILATRRGRFVTNDELTELLWAGRPPADPAANLQVLVTRARRAVGRPDVILTGPGGYALTAEDWCTVDTEDLLGALRGCAVRRGRAALEAYRAALDGTDAEPLAEDRYADWAEPYRARVFRARQDGWERAAALAVECGDPALAVEYATAAAQAEPLRETAALGLVRALAAAGDRAAALERYETYRTLLATELGLDPSPAAAAMQADLLAGGRTPGPAARVPPRPATFGPLRFVGRGAELDAIRAELSRSGSVRVAGRSGTGKSRLLSELAGSRDTIAVRAFWPDRDEPWSLARTVLRDLVEADAAPLDALPGRLRSALGALLPDRAPEAAAFDPESRRALTVEAAARLFGTVDGAVLIVDDLQWADPTSVHLVATVASRNPGLDLVVAYRPEEIDPDGPVAAFLHRLPCGAPVDLGPLPPAAVAELVADPPVARALTTHTDRTPIALSEVIRALAAEGTIRRTPDGRWHAGAAHAAARAAQLGRTGQRRAIARRVADHTDSPTATLLHLLALLARETPARTLATAAAVPEQQALGVLAALSSADLVRLGERGWALSHDMVGDVVTDILDRAERGRLHGLLAAALDAEDGDPAERARHWQDAGDANRAAAAYAQAATQALHTFAGAEAERLAGAGLALSDIRPAVRADLHEARAQARRRHGDIDGARRDLRAALDLHRDRARRSLVLAGLASLVSGAEDLVVADDLAQLAIIEAADQPAAHAQALEVASVIDMNLGRPRKAADRAAEALAIYHQLGDSGGVARILDARAMATFMEGDIRAGTPLLDRAANLFEDSGDLMRTVTPRSTRGHGLVFLARPAEGMRDADRALTIARTLGHPEGQSYALWHRCEALSALGRAGEALAAGREARDIATRVGHRGWTATAWRAIGIAHQATGDLDAASHAFTTSLELSANLDLFGCWAAARSALVSIALGDLDRAATLIAQALATGPPLGRYEAHWASAELAVARTDPNAPDIVATAIATAEAGGALAYLPRLHELLSQAA